MCSKVNYFKSGTENILKCLKNLGVTSLRPPPGEAQALIYVISIKLMKNNLFKSYILNIFNIYTLLSQ